ncbi:hypothetical protein L2E82_40510 [Cichorium intybus]|uniref:Uncharacterized protein n=1 Tax=Cichorium intybus TaxID=13427 RepID=A0ACB9ALB0_CICIN|nr:hypothetical protein L2E82_40510 [Cichorium intybus]
MKNSNFKVFVDLGLSDSVILLLDFLVLLLDSLRISVLEFLVIQFLGGFRIRKTNEPPMNKASYYQPDEEDGSNLEKTENETSI